MIRTRFAHASLIWSTRTSPAPKRVFFIFPDRKLMFLKSCQGFPYDFQKMFQYSVQKSWDGLFSKGLLLGILEKVTLAVLIDIGDELLSRNCLASLNWLLILCCSKNHELQLIVRFWYREIRDFLIPRCTLRDFRPWGIARSTWPKQILRDRTRPHPACFVRCPKLGRLVV
jgi:hypothetical protein